MAFQQQGARQANRPQNRFRGRQPETVLEQPIDPVQYDPQVLEQLRISVLSGNLPDVQRAVLGMQSRGYSIDVRIEGRSLLHHVLSLAEEQVEMQQMTGIVAFLLGQGIEVNALDEGRRTPLFLAAERGAAPIAKLLLEHGASPHVPDRFQNYPLHAAAKPTIVSCPRTFASPDPLQIPLSFVSSQIEDIVYDRGIAQYIKKTMESAEGPALRRYLLYITRLLMDSVQIDRDIRKHIFQLYLPTTNPLEQYHSIYQKVLKKLSDRFGTFYTKDNLFQLEETTDRPRHFLRDTFTPPGQLVEQKLQELHTRLENNRVFFQEFRPDMTTARKVARMELTKGLKNLVQMVFCSVVIDHLDNDARNNSMFQLYFQYMAALGKGTPPADTTLSFLVANSLTEWKEEVLELPIATLQNFFAALGVDFEIPLIFRKTNPTTLRDMDEKRPFTGPPAKGSFNVRALYYFLNNFGDAEKLKVMEHAVRLHSYRAYMELLNLESYQPPTPLTGEKYLDIGLDLKRFRDTSPYIRHTFMYDVLPDQLAILREIDRMQLRFQQLKTPMFTGVQPLEKLHLNLMDAFQEREGEFLRDTRRHAFYVLAANLIRKEATPVAFPPTEQTPEWSSFEIHSAEDTFRIATTYFRVHVEKDEVRDIAEQNVRKKDNSGTLLDYQRLLQLLKHQWLFEFHEQTPYIRERLWEKSDNFNVRQQMILSIRMLEQVTELVKQHLDLQRPAIAYMICFKIYEELIKMYNMDQIKENISFLLLRKFKKKFTFDNDPNTLRIVDDAAPTGGEEKPVAEPVAEPVGEAEMSYVKERGLKLSALPRLVDRINEYLPQLSKQIVSLRESNVFMKGINFRNQISFLLKKDQTSGEKKGVGVFRVDQRVTSSICYAAPSPVVELLLNNGANPNAQNDRNETVIYEVIRTLNYPLFKQLIQAGASLLTISNVYREKPIDVMCSQFERHSRYQYVFPQTALFVRAQIEKVSNTYSLSFVEPLVDRVLRGIWRPVSALRDARGRLVQVENIKSRRKNPVRALSTSYLNAVKQLPDFPPDAAHHREPERQPPEDSSEVLQELLALMRDIRRYFESGVVHLDDVAELRTRIGEAIALHSRIYRYIELQNGSASGYDQLVYNFQSMLEELFQDEVPVRPASELYTFILEEVILAEVDPGIREKTRVAVTEQLNTLEASLKKNAMRQSIDQTASLNAAELVGHLFGLLQGLPEMQGRSLNAMQNFVTTCYESTVNALRDLYFTLGSAHLKMHILLEMIHHSLQHIEAQIRS